MRDRRGTGGGEICHFENYLARSFERYLARCPGRRRAACPLNGRWAVTPNLSGYNGLSMESRTR